MNMNDIISLANGEGYSPEQLAGIALLLHQQRSLIDDSLEQIKSKLRTIALEGKASDQSVVYIMADFPLAPKGKVQITFMEPTLRLSKSSSPDSVPLLKDLLVQKVSYTTKKNIVSLIGNPPYSNLAGHFDVVESKPRVGFRPETNQS